MGLKHGEGSTTTLNVTAVQCLGAGTWNLAAECIRKTCVTLGLLQGGPSATEKAKETAESLKEKTGHAAEKTAEGLKTAAGKCTIQTCTSQ